MGSGGFHWSRRTIPRGAGGSSGGGRISVEQEDSNIEEDLVRAGGIHSGSQDSSGVGGRMKTQRKQIE